MFKVKKLLNSIFSFVKHVPKKAYTNGLVLISGSLVLTLLVIGINGFLGTGKHALALGVGSTDEQISSEDTLVQEMDEITPDEVEELPEDDLDLQLEEEKLLIIEEANRNIAPKLTASKQDDSKELHTFSLKGNDKTANIMSVSPKDYEALIKIVEAEATNEDIIGKIMVANVVINRVAISSFPNSIYDVVHQKIKGKAQFSPIDDGRYYSLDISDSTKEAVERALTGEDHSNGALYFVARSLASSKAVSWFDENLTKVAHHGVHEFFK